MPKRVARPRAAPWLLVLVLLLAIGLRLYRLDQQSITFDEFNALVHAPDATLSEYLAFTGRSNLDHMPLYFVLVYGWTSLAGAGPLGLRLTSVFLGCLMVAAVYLAGRRLYGHGAGLIAALCIALSPLHVYHHQAIRYSALLDLQGAVSLWLTLHIAARGMPRWILLHAALNSFMVCTHPSAAPLVAIEYFYLIWRWRSAGSALLSGALHAPAALFVLYRATSAAASELTWYPMPTPLGWLNDLLADASVTACAEFQMTPLIFQLGETAHLPGLALLLCMGAILLWALAQLRKPNAEHVLLVAVAVLPLLMYTALSFAWQPVALPRYTVYSSVALYLLAGRLLATVQPRLLRFGAVATLTALLCTQLGTSLTSFVRPDWRGAAREINTQGRPGDRLLGLTLIPEGAQPVPGPPALLQANAPALNIQARQAYTLAGALEQAISAMPHAPTNGGQWLLIEDWMSFPQRPRLEKALRDLGVQYRDWHSANLHLYYLLALEAPPVPVEVGDLFGPQEGELKAALRAGADADPAIMTALRWGLPAVPTQTVQPPLLNEHITFTYGLGVLDLCPRAWHDLSQPRINAQSAYAWEIVWAALGLLGEGDIEGGRQRLAEIPPDLVEYLDWLAPGFQKLAQGDFLAARKEMQRYEEVSPGWIPPFFHYLIGTWPPLAGSALKPLPPQ